MKRIWLACCAILILLAVVLFPVFVHESVPSTFTQCMTNLHKLATATQTYMAEHHDRFPPVEKWNDVLREPLSQLVSSSEGIDKIFICPSASDKSQPTYAMNSRLDGISGRDVADAAHTVLYFESIPGRNLAGGPELLPPKPRHEKGYVVVFVGMRVEYHSKSSVQKLIWNPARRPPATE
jgi:hypothetical protein